MSYPHDSSADSRFKRKLQSDCLRDLGLQWPSADLKWVGTIPRSDSEIDLAAFGEGSLDKAAGQSLPIINKFPPKDIPSIACMLICSNFSLE